MGAPVALDAVILGGGAAGLWLLGELLERGYGALLLEAGELGGGQTIASQGILHGGLKFGLGDRRRGGAAVRDMPMRWRQSLAGERGPDLSRTRLRAHYCHVWHDGSVRCRLAMLGASARLRVRPVALPAWQRPAVLRRCAAVARLDEQVVEPASLLSNLASLHRERILRIEAEGGLEFRTGGGGSVVGLELAQPGTGTILELCPRWVILAAGAGNGALRRRLGLPEGAMQRRPLRMVMVRGDLPELNGHCLQGRRPRVTVTTTRDTAGVVVWQVGGEVAEVGATRDEQAQLAHAAGELRAAIPGLDPSGLGWATYAIDRAEPAAAGRRPDDAGIVVEGNVVTAWPTKLVLVPRLADAVIARLGEPAGRAADPTAAIPPGWPRPVVALPPWETRRTWCPDP